MKKGILFTALFTVLALASQAQNRADYQKKPLYEVFTSSTCGPCAGANPIIDHLLENNHGKYSLIKYQVDWPGSGDIYFLPETKKRTAYYDVTGVPDMFVNGLKTSPYSLTQTIFNEQIAQTTPVKITMESSITKEHQVVVKTTIVSNESINETTNFHLMVVEKDTYKNKGYNGELVFYNVLMGFFTNSAGREIERIEANKEITFTDTLEMEGTHVEEMWDLSVVSFIQKGSKEILQSEMEEVNHSALDYNTITVKITDDSNNPLKDAEFFVHTTKSTNEKGELEFYTYDGEFDYVISKAGYYSKEGTYNYTKSETLTYVLEKPNSQVYETFDFCENYTLPEGWHTFSTSGGIFVNAKQLIFRQKSDAAKDNVLLLPKVNLAKADKISFKAGNKYYKPKLQLGTMSDPEDFTTFKLLEQFEPAKDSMGNYEYDFTQYTDTLSYLAFQMPFTNANANFAVDDVLITTDVNEATYALSLYVSDADGTPIKSVKVTLGESVGYSDENGYVCFSDLGSGNQELNFMVEGFVDMDSSFVITDNNRIDHITMTMVSSNDSFQENVTIYPNPVMSQLNLSGLTDYETITVFSCNGQCIYKQQLSNSTTGKIITQSWESGVYYLRIEGQNKITIVKKVVKK